MLAATASENLKKDNKRAIEEHEEDGSEKIARRGEEEGVRIVLASAANSFSSTANGQLQARSAKKTTRGLHLFPSRHRVDTSGATSQLDGHSAGARSFVGAFKKKKSLWPALIQLCQKLHKSLVQGIGFNRCIPGFNSLTHWPHSALHQLSTKGRCAFAGRLIQRWIRSLLQGLLKSRVAH